MAILIIIIKKYLLDVFVSTAMNVLRAAAVGDVEKVQKWLTALVC